MESKKRNYIEPEDFHNEYELSLINDEPTAKLISMFEKIAVGLSSTLPQFNKIDTDATINYGVTEAWKKWKKYNPERSNNIFSFFTTIIFNDMRTHHNQIKKNRKRHISIDAIFNGNKEH